MGATRSGTSDASSSPRDAIGDDAELFVDANGAYTRKQAIRLASTFADLGVTWFEEPVSSDDLDGLHEIRDAIEPDVAAGEYGYDLVYFERMCAHGQSTCSKPMSRAVRASPSGCEPRASPPRTVSRSPVIARSRCTSRPACAVPNLRHLEYFHDHARVDRLLFDGVLDPTGRHLASRSRSARDGPRTQGIRRRAVPGVFRRVGRQPPTEGSRHV